MHTVSHNFVLVKRKEFVYNINEIYISQPERGTPTVNNTDMETFWAVLEYGTMTAAAEALFITQPTLTNRLHALEHEVGAQLFRRGKGIRHIELTEAGQRFLPLAYRWQTLLEDTRDVAETVSREYLRIGAVFSTNQYILPVAYRHFLQRKLPVSLWVQTLSGDGYEGAQIVARGDLEMAMMDGDIFYHPQLEITPLCSEESFIVCSPDSPYGELISPQELDPENEIVVSWRKATQDWRDHWFGLAVKPLLYADSLQVVDSFLGWDVMWAVVPAMAARALQSSGRARICRLTDPPPERVSYLVTRRGEELSHAAQLLLEDVYTQLRSMKDIKLFI